MSSPVPSNLVLLAELGDTKPGTKVRFLGCIDEYVIRTATLRLKHDYPPSDVPKIAIVNIQHVLESIKRTDVEVGSWINVIGYVVRGKEKEKGIFVQAVAVWNAGNVDLEAYQQAIAKRKEAG